MDQIFGGGCWTKLEHPDVLQGFDALHNRAGYLYGS
jgi:hypothetical protein